MGLEAGVGRGPIVSSPSPPKPVPTMLLITVLCQAWAGWEPWEATRLRMRATNLLRGAGGLHEGGLSRRAVREEPQHAGSSETPFFLHPWGWHGSSLAQGSKGGDAEN